MTLDGITLGAIVRELARLNGAKIEKVHQPAQAELRLILHTQEGRKRLLISAAGGDSRLHLTESQRENPAKAPNFCMLLRKYIAGGRILEIKQIGLERVVRIEIEAKDEMGVPTAFALVCEIMGKYSNILLLGREDRVMGAIRPISLDTSRVRPLAAGMRYELPPMDKHNPLEEDEDCLARAIAAGPLPAVLVERIQGMSPVAAQEILARLPGGPDASAHCSERECARAVIAFVRSAVFAPSACLQKDMEGRPVFYSPLPYVTYSQTGRMAAKSMNAAVDAYYDLRETAGTLEHRRQALQKVLRRDIARVEKKLRIGLETIQAEEKCDKLRLYGELLTANLHLIKRGMREVTVTNYYTGQPIAIPLDEKLSPSANASRCFKKVTKLKNGAAVARVRTEQYRGELAFLYDLEYALESAANLEDLAEVRSELIKYGYLEAAPKEKVRRSDPLAHPMKFQTDGGFTLLAGRNSRQNDALTLRIAGPEDLWFHAKNIPGSHVILFKKDREPGEQDILQAAGIAAALSKAKAAGKVEVDCAPRSRVWKANGARPGMVLYEGQKTYSVRPDRELLERLAVQDEQ